MVKQFLGNAPTVVLLPSFRRTRMFAQAQRLAEEQADASGALDGVRTHEAMWELARAALSLNDRACTRARNRAVAALKDRLPLGAVRTIEDLHSLLSRWTDRLADLKAEELRTLLDAPGPDPACVRRAAEEKRRLLKDARTRIRNLAQSRGTSDDAYDRCHGPYARLVSQAIVPAAVIDRGGLLDRLRALLGTDGYQEAAPERPDEQPNALHRRRVWISLLDRVWLIEGDVWLELCRDLSHQFQCPVLQAGAAAPFDKECWAAHLYVGGHERSRHCSAPGILEQVSDLVEEGVEDGVIRRLVAGWCGNPAVFGEAFRVAVASIAPYLVQFEVTELQEIWDDPRLFVALRGNEEDPYSLASPWAKDCLFARLGAGEGMYQGNREGSLVFEKPEPTR